MFKRLLTAALLLPLLILTILYGGPFGAAVLLALAAGVGVWEFLSLGDSGFTKTEKIGLSLAGAALPPSFLSPLPHLPSALLALLLLAHLLYEGRREISAQSLTRVCQAAAALFVVAFFLGHGVLLAMNGPAPLFFLMILVMLGDTAAYFTGTFLGRHRLAPSISPKKSVEGSLGGLLAVGCAGWFLAPLFKLPHPPLESLFIALLINVAAQTGDLAESLWKRAAGVKDSGTIFPGHGGMLDRVDAFLPTLPLYATILALYGGK